MAEGKSPASTEGKIIVLSAPSGSGKSTLIKKLLDRGDLNLQFSVSATNRKPREGEQDGVHYHFLTTDEFRRAIDEDRFVEWEEVYPGGYYGTLKSEIDRKIASGINVVLDIDVKGGLNVKKLYGDHALTIFIQPPSRGELERRLRVRGTETEEAIADRIGKAEYELSFAPRFDTIVVNDNLETAAADLHNIINNFISH